MIERWNGRTWRVVPTPRAGTGDSDLWGVTALSASTPTHAQGLIEHWNGHHWTAARTPAAPGSSLADVLALSPHLAWAVGSAAAPHGYTRTHSKRWPAPTTGRASQFGGHSQVSRESPSTG